MSDWVDELAGDIDKLLLEIGFTGALYGAGDLCLPVYTYLRTSERCAKAAVLAEAMAHIAKRQYDTALTMLDDFMAAEGVEEYADAALGYKLMALKLKGDTSAFQALAQETAEGSLSNSMAGAL